jgi:hypothetical protein|tara:strand:- start:407 stop:637 length:231 start_codon:yes stop_codon:yes gene_type:complete
MNTARHDGRKIKAARAMRAIEVAVLPYQVVAVVFAISHKHRFSMPTHMGTRRRWSNSVVKEFCFVCEQIWNINRNT